MRNNTDNFPPRSIRLHRAGTEGAINITIEFYKTVFNSSATAQILQHILANGFYEHD